MPKTGTLALLMALSLSSCKIKKNIMTDDLPHLPTTLHLDVQGHRGCRGLLPENTIPAFMKAMELGVTTLELDLVISKDHQVIVSHEPFFNHEISSLRGTPITEAEEKSHNIYQLTREELEYYDVGKVPHPRFPDQEKMAVTKPTLIELAEAVHRKSKALGRPLPFFNVEIKRVPEQDGLYHPGAEVFAQLVIDAIHAGGIEKVTYIQSFDVASLEAARRIDSALPLVYLIGNEEGFETNMAKLSFTPEVYSPYFKLVDVSLVKACQGREMQLIPWTVNEVEDMDAMLDLGVQGIITDYPDRLLDLIQRQDHVMVK